jgi:hypothetical protein
MLSSRETGYGALLLRARSSGVRPKGDGCVSPLLARVGVQGLRPLLMI